MRWKYRIACRVCGKRILQDETYMRFYTLSDIDEKLDREEFEHESCYLENVMEGRNGKA